MHLLPKLNEFVSTIDLHSISEERKNTLQPLIDYLQEKQDKKQEIRLNFICTHNSRRSHLAQIWAQTAACYLGFEKVFCYSGGTEITAVYPVIIETLKNVGFDINTLSSENNPIYSIKYAANEHPVIAFSKKMQDEFNPKSAFCAIMTCSEADGNCPFVSGAEKRIPITFNDPKEFDNTPQQAEKYQERNLQIASEMLYVFQKSVRETWRQKN